jgi:hypothetical protein
MPRKIVRSKPPPEGEALVGQLTIRLDPELERWLRRNAAEERAAHPGRGCTVSDVVRDFLHGCMRRERKENDGTP